ncbi:UTP--glucose-1-phosphate uridylyltransferase [Candidatus Saccharibacteria bacterium]|nr:MAG: UTP--glucose-1-phosphate uridylyltransferase [Candidatus Saccharibacteria bacterium]
MKRPTKAIIPAAGFGTRFLPQTKAMPKEMMPLIDKPIIQYVVEELVEAGIKDIIIVGSSNKRAIEDHFDVPNEDLLANLRAGGEKKQPFIDMIQNIANLANFIYVRQKGPYGNATPLLSAAHLIGDEPFVYTWADDFFTPEANSTRQMIDVYEQYQGGVFACVRASTDDDYERYGFAAGDEISEHLISMRSIVEKPGKANAPSALASVSGYLLPAELLRYIEQAAESHDENSGEFTFQPFVQQMIDSGHHFYAKEIEGGRFYDTGNPLEYLKTVVDFGLRDSKMGEEFAKYLQTRV